MWRRLPCLKSADYLKTIRMLDHAKAVQHEAQSMPPLEQRLGLFRDFIMAHSFLLTRVREIAVCEVHGRPDSFDFDHTYLLIAFSYRGDCEGNPARAFRVECVDLVRYKQEKYDDGTRKLLGEATTKVAAKFGARSFGSLKIMYRTAECRPEEDLRLWDVQPVFKPAWQARRFNIPRLPNAQHLCMNRYYSELLSASEHGLVVRHDADAGRCVIGELVKSGTHWRWERLTPAQLLERSLPAGFNDLMYDLVSVVAHSLSSTAGYIHRTHHLAHASGLIINTAVPLPSDRRPLCRPCSTPAIHPSASMYNSSSAYYPNECIPCLMSQGQGMLCQTHHERILLR